MVLTHGFGDDATTWDAVFADLTRDHTVLRWDLPGHHRSAGYSTDPADHLRDPARSMLSALIAETVQAAGTQGDAPGRWLPVLVGHSFGGYLSMCHAIGDAPIAGLVLVATGPGFRKPEAQARWNAMTEKAAEGFGLAPEVAPLCRQDDALVLDHLDHLDMPVRQIVGSRDRHYDDGIALLDRRLPDATSVRVEGARHHVHVSHPGPVVDAVRELAGRVGL